MEAQFRATATSCCSPEESAQVRLRTEGGGCSLRWSGRQ